MITLVLEHIGSAEVERGVGRLRVGLLGADHDQVAVECYDLAEEVEVHRRRRRQLAGLGPHSAELVEDVGRAPVAVWHAVVRARGPDHHARPLDRDAGAELVAAGAVGRRQLGDLGEDAADLAEHVDRAAARAQVVVAAATDHDGVAAHVEAVAKLVERRAVGREQLVDLRERAGHFAEDVDRARALAERRVAGRAAEHRDAVDRDPVREELDARQVARDINFKILLE